MNPKVSIILTTYNRPKMLWGAIMSIYQQTFKDWELIVIDDNSDMREQYEVLKKVEENYITQSKSVGTNFAKVRIIKTGVKEEERWKTARYATVVNIGLKLVKGEYVTYLCDDDYYLPDRLDRMVKFLDENPDKHVVFGWQKMVELKDGEWIEVSSSPRKQYGPLKNADCLVDHSSVMHRMLCVEKVGYWDENIANLLHADGVYWKKLGDNGFLFYPIQEVLDVHVYHEGSWTKIKGQETDIAVIIVNWNGKEYLEHCLPSLFAQAYQGFRVILVDNGSVDSSLVYTEAQFPHVEIIRCPSNLGFAKANNIGIRRALQNPYTKYIMTLNNDTELDKECIRQLVNIFKDDPQVGIVTGKIKNFYHRNKIDAAGDMILRKNWRVINRGKNEVDSGQYDIKEEVFSACAAASMIKREVLEAVCINGDFFDEDFGSYIEDVDLNIRARLLGWKCYYAPEAIVYHIGSATSNRLSRTWKHVLSRRNWLLTVVKNLPPRFILFSVFNEILPDRGWLILPFIVVRSHAKRHFPFLIKVVRFIKKKLLLYYYPVTTDDHKNDEYFSVWECIVIYFYPLRDFVRFLPQTLEKRKLIQKNRSVLNADVERWFKQFIINK